MLERVHVSTLVPYGVATPPPRTPAMLPAMRLDVAADVEALPSTSMPPPSASAVFSVTAVLLNDNVHSTHTTPPPLRPAFESMTLPTTASEATVGAAGGTLYVPMTAMPPPLSRDPLSELVALKMTLDPFSVTAALRIRMPPPSERKPCASPPRIVKELIVTVIAPAMSSTRSRSLPLMVDWLPSMISESVMSRSPLAGVTAPGASNGPRVRTYVWPLPRMTLSGPAFAFAAIIASRSEQSASHTPSAVSAVLVTTKSVADAGVAAARHRNAAGKKRI